MRRRKADNVKLVLLIQNSHSRDNGQVVRVAGGRKGIPAGPLGAVGASSEAHNEQKDKVNLVHVAC